MKNVKWTVRITAAPTVVKYCKKCAEKAQFVSSGMFRVNAQQKYLDVWLIYKCATCDTTWNLTILTRTNPKSIPPDMLAGFHGNDAALAMRYATNTALIRKNGGEPGLPDIEIAGEDIGIGEPGASGKLRCVSGQDIRKCKLTGEIIIEIE